MKTFRYECCFFIFHLSHYAFLEAPVNASSLRIFFVIYIVGGESYRCRRFDFCFLRFCCRRFKFFQNQNVSKVVAFFLLESFLPQDLKTPHFFEEISSPQKKVVIFAYSGGSDKEMIHRLYSNFFTVNLLGTKSFSLVTNFLIFSVHRGLIQNNKFQRFPPQPPSP